MTEYLTEDEHGHGGPDIEAGSWEEAQGYLNIWKDMGKVPETIEIIGELVERIPAWPNGSGK